MMVTLLQFVALLIALYLIPLLCLVRITSLTPPQLYLLRLARVFWSWALLFAVDLSIQTGNLLPVPVVATLLFVLSKVLAMRPIQTIEHLSENKKLVDCIEHKQLLKDELIGAYRELSEIKAQQQQVNRIAGGHHD